MRGEKQDLANVAHSRFTRFARVSFVAVFVLVAVVLLPGALLRGPLLVWTVEQASQRLCGDISIADGRVDVLLIPKLLTGRPINIGLRDVHVRAADGESVFFASDVQSQLSILWRQRKLHVRQASFQQGHWHFVSAGPGQPVGFLRAFRMRKNDGTRCTAPAFANPANALPRRPRSVNQQPSWSFVIEQLSLRHFDSRLSFPTWGISLKRTGAKGSVRWVEHLDQQRLFFSVRDIVAQDGGSLRVGRENSSFSLQVPFEHVAIAQVAVTKLAPNDVRLRVSAAKSGKARLRGEAIFIGALAAHPPGAPTGGIDVQATWRHFGAVLPQLLKNPISWPNPALPGDLQVNLRGPYTDLLGEIGFVGPRVQASVSLLPDHRVAAGARFNNMPTAPLLPNKLHALAAGHLHGHVSVKISLPGGGAKNLSGRVKSAALELNRAHNDHRPQTLRLRVGPGGELSRNGSKTAVLKMDQAVLDEGILRTRGVGLNWPGIRVRGGRLGLDVLQASPQFTAWLPRVRIDLGRLVQGPMVNGRLLFSLRAQGPLDDVAVTLDLTGRRRFEIFEQAFRLPSQLNVHLRQQRELKLARFRLQHLPVGSLEAWGRVNVEGRLAANVVLAKYPLVQLARLAATAIPVGGFGADQFDVAALARSISGKLWASLQIEGHVSKPRVNGQIALSQLSIAGQSLGNGGLSVSSHGGDVSSIRVQGRLFQSLGMHAEVKLEQPVEVALQLNPKKFPVGAFAPARHEVLHDLQLSGRAHVKAVGNRFTSVTARMNLNGTAAQLNLSAGAKDNDVSATVNGTLAADAITSMLPYPVSGSGWVGIDMKINKAAGGQALIPQGQIVAAGPISLQAAVLPFAVSLDSNSAIKMKGQRFELHDFVLRSEAGVVTISGGGQLDQQKLGQTELALLVLAHLDPAALVARTTAIRSASGELVLKASVQGTVARPLVQSTLRLADVKLSSPSLSAVQGVTINGFLQTRGNVLFSSDLRVVAGSGGHLALGSTRHPAVVQLRGFHPLQWAQADLPLRGRNLYTSRPVGRLSLRGVDFDLQLLGDDVEGYLLRGDIEVDRAVLQRQVRKRPTSQKHARTNVLNDFARDLELDLRLIGSGKALGIDVPVIPNVNVAFRCHIEGLPSDPRIAGKLRGSGVYSRLVVWLYDVFSSSAVRRCDVVPG